MKLYQILHIGINVGGGAFMETMSESFKSVKNNTPYELLGSEGGQPCKNFSGHQLEICTLYAPAILAFVYNYELDEIYDACLSLKIAEATKQCIYGIGWVAFNPLNKVFGVISSKSLTGEEGAVFICNQLTTSLYKSECFNGSLAVLIFLYNSDVERSKNFCWSIPNEYQNTCFINLSQISERYLLR